MDLDDLLEDVPDKTAVQRAKTQKPKVVKKNDDDWGEMGLDDEVKSTGGFGNNNSARGSVGGLSKQQSASFGFGGENGLRKEPMKKEEEDEWALDSKPAASSGFGGGGRLLGRKPKNEDNDDLDNFLDDLE
jgi:hypothetical protein